MSETTPDRWTSSSVHPDMWVVPDQDPRDTGPTAGERDTVLSYLTAYRLTFQMKCADLTAEQMAMRSVPPSTMSLLGLLRHLADVERSWFRRVMAGEDAPNRWPREPGPGAFDGAMPDQAQVDEAWSAWYDEVAYAERYVEQAGDFDARGTMSDGTSLELRDVLVHMIEEYARHCGHADLLRERIDGRVGQ